MSISNKILFIVVIVLLVALIALFVWRWWFAKPVSDYYALYLKSGELYFGKLVRFPYFGLKQVYMLQINNGDDQTPLSIQKFSKIFWGPEDYIRINRDEVVWMTRLAVDSELVRVIVSNPDLIPQNLSPQATSPVNNQGKDNVK
ncbi:MAG: hypothetical protein QMD50_02145 [Patescibacteria group bacterium]|nr:hypothetical protein [Patescibacteria group bacterium]